MMAVEIKLIDLQRLNVLAKRNLCTVPNVIVIKCISHKAMAHEEKLVSPDSLQFILWGPWQSRQ